MEYTWIDMVLFGALIIAALWIDLVAHKEDKAISLKNAALWSAFWVLLALVFAGYIYVDHGSKDMQLFLAGYFLEKSLSVDNLFVIMAVFTAFSIKDEYQHRVLYYGILGALILRFLFIFAGTALIELVGTPALVIFALFVLYTAYAMYKNMNADSEDIVDYSNHWSVRYVKKVYPVYPTVDSHNFFVRHEGKLSVTPLFLCLVCIEFADIMFAFDSVPAIIAITEEPFLVYSSNIFAILGLRSMYFLLAAAKRFLCHLEKAVIIILAFIGVKLLLTSLGGVHIPPMLSLAIVLGCLTAGIVGSFVFPEKEESE